MKPSATSGRICLPAAIVGLCIFIVCGCGFRQPAAQIQYYTLTYNAPEPIEGPTLPVAIHVRRFQSNPPYDSRRIVYAENAFQRTTYAYHQWMANPADILTGLFVRDLRAAKIAQTIVTEYPGTDVDYTIEADIEEFYESDITPDWQAVLTLSFSLVHTGDNRRPGAVLFQKTYRRMEPMERNNPVSLAQAMSAAMKSVSTSFMKDAYQQIASGRP